MRARLLQERCSSQPAFCFCVRKVHFLVTFLQQRGSTTSEEFRNRLKKRQPLQVRGYSFSAEVIKEALQVWEQRTFKTTRSSDLPPRAEQSPHNDRADAADAADTKAVSAQSTWTKPQAPHAEPQVPEVGFQKFMDASRRRTLSRSNADAKNADGGCLTRTWIEMAEARRTLGAALTFVSNDCIHCDICLLSFQPRLSRIHV
eukprot:g13895.t1